MDLGESRWWMLDPSLGELDLFWYRWEEELLLVHGGRQRMGENVMGYLDRVKIVFQLITRESLWGLP